MAVTQCEGAASKEVVHDEYILDIPANPTISRCALVSPHMMFASVCRFTSTPYVAAVAALEHARTDIRHIPRDTTVEARHHDMVTFGAKHP